MNPAWTLTIPRVKACFLMYLPICGREPKENEDDVENNTRSVAAYGITNGGMCALVQYLLLCCSYIHVSVV